MSAEEINVNYIKGKVETVDSRLKGVNSISNLELGSSVSSHQIIATAKGSRTELTDDSTLWRLGSLSVGRWLNNNDFWIHSGSILCSTKSSESFKISSTKSNAIFDGPGTFIIEATTNGGFKFIPLETNGFITTTKGGTKQIKGGRMLLVLGSPTNFGDAYDIDLMLMLKSSRLLNSFPQKLNRSQQIEIALFVQQMKLRGKYDALIGDATSDKNLQLWQFNKSNPEIKIK